MNYKEERQYMDAFERDERSTRKYRHDTDGIFYRKEVRHEANIKKKS